VQEKGSLTCELCQQQYKEPFVQQLEVRIKTAQQQQQQQEEDGHEEQHSRSSSCCGRWNNASAGQWFWLM
jgi:hypothetical protein